MKKILSTLLIITILFSLSGCGKKEPPPEPVQKEKVETPPFTEIDATAIETIKISNPYPEDILLDRFEDTLYYFNYKLGFYTTDPDGTEKERLKVFEGENFIFFNTPNRINRTDKHGGHFLNLVTRNPYEQIEVLFITSDWVYYKVKDINNNYKYYKYNNSGTSTEISRREIDEVVSPKIYAQHYYPQQIDSKTMTYEKTYRSRANNFSITFPDKWDGSYEIIDKKDLFIVKFKSRVSENLSYEFFRIKKANNENDWLPSIENTNNVFYNNNGKYLIGRYADEISKENVEYDLIKQMEVDIPNILYSLR